MSGMKQKNHQSRHIPHTKDRLHLHQIQDGGSSVAVKLQVFC